ncbi:MAG: polymer-forming cytoskeletal protein [Mucilaginibacter sp.]|nr:polymer-forming cytoskeletal protein [Mucilaginibacter sp.]
MSLVKYIKTLFFKEEIALPYMDELHVLGLFVKNDIVALNDVWVTKSLTGNIYCAKNIIVCKDVQVIGNINCRKCTLEGSVNGNISVSEMLEIKENAVLNGNIIARKLDVSSSAVLNGYITTINVKEARQVNSDIKLKIDEIQHLNTGKEHIITESKDPESVLNDSEKSGLIAEAPKIIIQPEKEKINIQSKKAEPVVNEDNGKWW